MKRLVSLMMVLAATLAVVAQVKLTPQARLNMEQQMTRVERKGSRLRAPGKKVQAQTIRLVVKIAAGQEAEAVGQLTQCGARIEGRLGQQVLVCLPVDSIESIGRIDAVQRIDVGRRPRLKTDMSREATGVSLLNGKGFTPTAQLSTPLTGKGITICVIDVGIDFQHPAFKNADGSSRIKCVYRMTDEGGNPFSYVDPDLGMEMTLPGSVYDTPELISTLTTDYARESHGTHTTSTAAGTLSPQGFGGMAPEADIVLIPVGDLLGESTRSMAKAYDDDDDFPWDDDDDDFPWGDDEEEEVDPEDMMTTALNFVYAYALKTGQPVMLSASMNSHAGPHDGTGAVPEAINFVSDYVIPVFSAGNEGEDDLYMHYVFTEEEPAISAVLTGFYDFFDSKSGEVSVTGLLDNVGDGACPALRFAITDAEGEPLWQSEPVTYEPDADDPTLVMLTSDADDELAEIYDGMLGLAIGEGAEGRLVFEAAAEGELPDDCFVVICVEAPAGAELNMWADGGGFEVTDESLATATSECSAGDWTSIEDVISVGAYCANPMMRLFSGEVWDMSDDYVPGDIAPFSSYGGLPGGVAQPLICAPGTNIVAAVNQNDYEDRPMDESMMWLGAPYDAMDGTSMSCPTVAGIVALWLQADPTLTLEQVKKVMEATAMNDTFTAADPIRWGYGKIDAKAGLDYIQENFATGISNMQRPALNASYLYDLQGRRVSTPQRGIYVQDGRKVVR